MFKGLKFLTLLILFKHSGAEEFSGSFILFYFIAFGNLVLRRMVLTEPTACIWKMRHSTMFYPQNLKIKTNHHRIYGPKYIVNIEMSFKGIETGDVA